LKGRQNMHWWWQCKQSTKLLYSHTTPWVCWQKKRKRKTKKKTHEKQWNNKKRFLFFVVYLRLMCLMKSPSPYLNKAWLIHRGVVDVAISRSHSSSSQKIAMFNDPICPFSIARNLKLQNLQRKCKAVLRRSNFFKKNLENFERLWSLVKLGLFERTSWKHKWFSQLAKVKFLCTNLKTWAIFKVGFLWKNLGNEIFLHSSNVSFLSKNLGCF